MEGMTRSSPSLNAKNTAPELSVGAV